MPFGSDDPVKQIGSPVLNPCEGKYMVSLIRSIALIVKV